MFTNTAPAAALGPSPFPHQAGSRGEVLGLDSEVGGPRSRLGALNLRGWWIQSLAQIFALSMAGVPFVTGFGGPFSSYSRMYRSGLQTRRWGCGERCWRLLGVGPAVSAIVFRQHFIFSSFPANKLERRPWASKGQTPHGQRAGRWDGKSVSSWQMGSPSAWLLTPHLVRHLHRAQQ